MWLQLILTVVFYLWLFLVLFFLWRLAKDANMRTKELQAVLLAIAQQNAHSARVASDAAQTVAHVIENTITKGNPPES